MIMEDAGLLVLLLVGSCYVGISVGNSDKAVDKLEFGIYLMAGGLPHSTYHEIEFYNPTIEKLTCSINPPPLNNKWWLHTIFFHNNTFHLCGGYKNPSICISYNAYMNESTTHTLTTLRKSGHSSAVLENKVYFIGGVDYPHAETTALPLTEQPVLTPVPNLDYKGYYQCVVKIDDANLVITGGYKSRDHISNVTQYNSQTSTATSLPSLKQARNKHGCVLVEINNIKVIIVTGGNNAEGYLRTTEMLDLEGSSWVSLGNLNGERYGHTSVASERGVLIMGGYREHIGYLSSVEILDWSSKEWNVIQPSLNQPRYLIGGVLKIPASMFNCTGTTLVPATCPPVPTCPPIATCPDKTCPSIPSCPTVPPKTTCPLTPNCPTKTCPATPTCPTVPEQTPCPAKPCPPIPTCPTEVCPPISKCPSNTCPPTPTCSTNGAIATTIAKTSDTCDDTGCKNAFNGLGMCVDTSSTNWVNVSKTIDFAAGTKDGKCSKDCNCNCFKHTGCYSDQCDARQGICLIPEQVENRGFFIPNEYKKAFPCNKSLNCYCYIKNYVGVTKSVESVTKPRSNPSCKPNKKCTKKNGKCFGKGDTVPKNAKKKGWCNKKAGCKCYKV